MAVDFNALLGETTEILLRKTPIDRRLQDLCGLLKRRVPHYDWVGFYLRDGRKRELVLGPYAGEPTEHARIPFGRGICGQAAERGETFVVQDVSKETNYVACSAKVKSEIVVPIMNGGEVAGDLDVDSHALAPFTAEDRAFLKRVASEVANVLSLAKTRDK